MADALDNFIARMRNLKTFATDVAKRAAPLLETAAREHASKGLDPNGRPWAPKKDGGPALKNAASQMTATPIGSNVALTIAGPVVFHNVGNKHAQQRQVIPDGAVPSYLGEAIREAAGEQFKKAIGGGS